MKKAGIIVLVCGSIGLIGSLLPLAEADTVYFSIQHGGGLLPLLYVLPIVLIILGSMTLAGKLNKLSQFAVPISVLGLIFSGMGIYSAMVLLELMSSGMMGNMMGQLSKMSKEMGIGQMEVSSPSPGIGGILLIISFIGAIIGSLLNNFESRIPTQGDSQ